jgi:hypothetical protein
MLNPKLEGGVSVDHMNYLPIGFADEVICLHYMAFMVVGFCKCSETATINPENLKR